jgi:hypothetical protein
MEKRICPSCKKQYYENESICPQCHVLLADVDPEFEIVLSAIPEPVILTDGYEVKYEYLMEALEKRRISYYIEDGKQLEYSGKKVRPFSCNVVYVDKSRFTEAFEALEEAKEEQQIDDEMPTVFLDFPEDDEDDWEYDRFSQDYSEGYSDNYSKESYGGPLYQDLFVKLLFPGFAVLFVFLIFWFLTGVVVPVWKSII